MREQVCKGKIKLENCKREEEIAYVLTKFVTVQVFQKLRDQMIMEILANLN